MNALRQQFEIDNRKNPDDDQQDNARRGCIADLEEPESVLVDVIDQRIGGVDRAALRHDGDGLEHLERTDHVDDHQEEYRWRQHGQNQLSEGRPRFGAIQRGRFIDIRRDALQPRDEHQRVVAKSLPYGYDDQ